MCLQRANPFSCWMCDHHINLIMEGTNPLTMSQLLHPTMEGTNPLTMSKRLNKDTSLPLWRNLDLENTKLLPEVLKLHPSQCLSQHISYLFILLLPQLPSPNLLVFKFWAPPHHFAWLDH